MSQIGSITNKVLSNHKQFIESTSNTLGHDKSTGNFTDRLENALNNVADAQKQSSELAKAYELGSENIDLSKSNDKSASFVFELQFRFKCKK